MKRLIGTVAALSMLAAFAVPVHAQTLLTPDTWYDFSWDDGLGPIDDPAAGFMMSSLDPIRLLVVDCCVLGDEFDVYVSGTPYATTPIDPSLDGTQFGYGDPWGLWYGKDMSRGDWYFAPGDYTVDISVSRLAWDDGEDAVFMSGTGSIMAMTAPEPVTVILMASGLLGLGGVGLLRRREDELEDWRRAGKRPSSNATRPSLADRRRPLARGAWPVGLVRVPS